LNVDQGIDPSIQRQAAPADLLTLLPLDVLPDLLQALVGLEQALYPAGFERKQGLDIQPKQKRVVAAQGKASAAMQNLYWPS